MDYLVATHNKGKRDELVRILSPLGIRVFLPEEKGITLSEPVEDADSFEGNALIKARAGCRESGMPCIADDSGLCVDALDGRPGVFTARYHGEKTPYREKMEFLLDEMKNVPAEKRTARLVCSPTEPKRQSAEPARAESGMRSSVKRASDSIPFLRSEAEASPSFPTVKRTR